MINQQILNYIKEQKELNVSEEEIRKVLLGNGFSENEIADAFSLDLMALDSSEKRKKLPRRTIVMAILGTIIILISILGAMLKLTKIGNDFRFNLAIGAAKNSWKENKPDSIIASSEKALSLSRSDSQKSIAYYWMGIGYYRLNNLFDAERYENMAIELNADFAGSYVTLGAIKLAQGNVQSAEELAHKALEKDPNYSWSHNLMGSVFIRQGKKADAIREINKAIELEPSQDIFKQNLAAISQR